MGPVGEDELQALAARQLAHLDREPPVDRPGHLGDDAPHLLPLVGHDPCDQLSGSRGGLSTVALARTVASMILGVPSLERRSENAANGLSVPGRHTKR